MKAKLAISGLGLALMVACSPAASPKATDQPSSAAAPTAQRTLTMAIRLEPVSLSLRPPKETFSNVDHTRIFNADFALVDDKATPVPYMSESLPQLNTNDWQVLPDGR